MNLFTLLFPNLPPVRLPVHHDIEDIQALKVENLKFRKFSLTTDFTDFTDFCSLICKLL